jgi:predicted ATP-grasp superfamily ATP-dependent carboligase
MKVLVFEYVTGGGMAAETVPASLLREGGLMRDALLRDLSDIPEVRPVALRDARYAVAAAMAPLADWIAVVEPGEAGQRFRERIEAADAVWPIAPETGGVLEHLCREVERAGKPLLTSPTAAVRIAAGKRATAERLEAHGVPVVPTVPWEASAPPPSFPVVVKPDDGAGCEGTRLLETPEDWDRFAETRPAGPYVVQPLVEGEALSLSVLFGHGQARLLSGNRQRVVRERGGFVLKGCWVNAIEDDLGVFRTLAERLGQVLPELWGYAGVDLIRSERGLHVLEVNPRLTTSYAGLRRSTGLNPAKLVLDLWREGKLPEFEATAGQPVEISLEPNHVH